MNSEAASPKLFVSYSWTSLDHENWVIQLATYLRESGIDVILDKWDLKEGHDGNAFMEQMVTDPEIRKVILVCDKGYFGKADKRAGGVGTETQIITPQIYKKQAQDKFVAIVTERDDDDNAYIPAYYGSRIFIDLSDPSTYSENFERLLRWAFDEPLHKKPSLGSKPAFLLDEGHSISLSTSSRHRRATDSLVHDRPNALALVRVYFEILTMEVEKFRIDSDSEGEFDDFVIQNIESFLPYRNEVIAIFCHLARNNNTVETANVVHQFMEGSIPYMERPRDVQGWRETDFDNYKFIIHELFLYAVACFIRNLPDEFLDYGTSMISFEIFRRHLKQGNRIFTVPSIGSHR